MKEMTYSGCAATEIDGKVVDVLIAKDKDGFAKFRIGRKERLLVSAILNPGARIEVEEVVDGIIGISFSESVRGILVTEL